MGNSLLNSWTASSRYHRTSQNHIVKICLSLGKKCCQAACPTCIWILAISVLSAFVTLSSTIGGLLFGFSSSPAAVFMISLFYSWEKLASISASLYPMKASSAMAEYITAFHAGRHHACVHLTADMAASVACDKASRNWTEDPAMYRCLHWLQELYLARGASEWGPGRELDKIECE